MDIDDIRPGGKPTVEQWKQLQSQGWTVDSWNAEMDYRERVAADAIGPLTVLLWGIPIGFVFLAIVWVIR